VLAPLGVLEALGLPLTAPILAVLAALGALSALAWGVDLDRSLGPPLGGLSEALRRLSQGDFAVRLHPSGADALGQAAADLKESASALERRERALRAFGPGVDPVRGVALLPGLGAPAEARFVAVLAAGWRGADASLSALEPAARLGALGRFYQSVQDAVQRCGGTVLELGGGQVLAAWGAPGAPTSPATLASPSEAECLAGSIKAAWMLRSSLAVAASQYRLRHAGALDWSLAVSSGLAAAGAWGPRQEPRWALVGGPVGEVRRLSLRPGGPWLDEASASAAASPYAVRSLADAWELVGGPE
jgi:adenylate cyclase